MPNEDSLSTKARRTPWNKGKLIGAKNLRCGQTKFGRSVPGS